MKKLFIVFVVAFLFFLWLKQSETKDRDEWLTEQSNGRSSQTYSPPPSSGNGVAVPILLQSVGEIVGNAQSQTRSRESGSSIGGEIGSSIGGASDGRRNQGNPMREVVTDPRSGPAWEVIRDGAKAADKGANELTAKGGDANSDKASSK